MQVLRERLDDITKILSQLSRTDTDALNDAKNLKSLVFVIDKVLILLDNESCTLQQLRLRTLKKLDSKVANVRPLLEAAESRFMVKYDKPATAEPQLIKSIPVSIAGASYICPFYREKRDIPVLSYGAVMIRSEPVIVFRYSPRDYVSVTACQVIDGSNYDNMHTVCCGNGATCEYGASCRYFHDPVDWPDSKHVQKFQRSQLVKRCPQFGNAADFTEQVATLSFDQLRTLARYSAIQMLLIHLVANR